MTTRATATLQGIADSWETLFGSAVFSGIVGDLSHAQRGGYHISIADQTNPDNYSVIRPDDKAPPGDWPRDCAAAIDMNLNLGDMKTCHTRLVAVWRNRAADPRARYVNAHNGWDGEGSPGRYDWITGSVSTASDDHEWHAHLEVRRRYVNDPEAARAILSILRGDTIEQYLGEDMDWTDDVIQNPAWRGDATTNKFVQARFALYAMWDEAHKATVAAAEAGAKADRLAAKVDTLAVKLTELAGKDQTDEPAIIAGVLAGLDPAKIAEAVASALPQDQAQQVADEIAQRLSAGSASA